MCALALPSLWGHILICLVCRTQPLTMKWSENQRSRLTSNRPMPADINKRAGSGLRVCAEIFEWENAVVYCYSTLFVLKLGDDNLDIQCAICSKFVNFYAPGMVKTLGPQHFPVLIPYSHRTKSVFSNFGKKNTRCSPRTRMLTRMTMVRIPKRVDSR